MSIVRTRYRSGPRIDLDRVGLSEAGLSEPASPSLKGWVLGLLCCALIAAVLPHIDLVIRSTKYSMNLLPPTSLFFLITLILTLNMGLARWRKALSLSRADLALVFMMTMLINPLPTYGFMCYASVEQMGGFFYADSTNRWDELIHPHIPEGLAPRDPVNPADPGPRPVQWFFSGLPPGEQIPWAMLAGPYARWSLALLLILGMFLAAGALLHRHWSEREKLPFPLAQVPQQMMGGLPGARDDGQTPFLRDRLAWWGIGVVFALHGYNALQDYYPALVAPIPLRITHIQGTYLTEGIWRHTWPWYFNIYPSVIGIMYLISLEVGFSLWFYYAMVLKTGVLIAVLWFALGNDGSYFSGSSAEGAQSIFIAQGTGACFMMVLAGFFLARATIGESLRQAVGLAPPEDPSRLGARTIWSLLLACFAGSVAWLMWAGVSFPWALLAVVILLASVIGVTRLVSEGGVFWLQMYGHPAEQLASVFTPVGLGSANFVVLTMWSRVFCFDWYRSNPMINIVGALHLGSLVRMRGRPLALGLAAALLVTFLVSFFSFYKTAYTSPGGARQFGWAFESHARNEFKNIADKVQRIEAWEKKRAAHAEKGREVPAREVPAVARTDWVRLSWMGAGALAMAGFLFARTRLFWFPHPIGYVMWMGMWPLHRMWFSYFLGWLVKALILRFGGHRVYMTWRRFFIGLIVGEALAIVFWTAIHWVAGHREGYTMEYN